MQVNCTVARLQQYIDIYQISSIFCISCYVQCWQFFCREGHKSLYNPLWYAPCGQPVHLGSKTAPTKPSSSCCTVAVKRLCVSLLCMQARYIQWARPVVQVRPDSCTSDRIQVSHPEWEVRVLSAAAESICRTSPDTARWQHLLVTRRQPSRGPVVTTSLCCAWLCTSLLPATTGNLPRYSAVFKKGFWSNTFVKCLYSISAAVLSLPPVPLNYAALYSVRTLEVALKAVNAISLLVSIFKHRHP